MRWRSAARTHARMLATAALATCCGVCTSTQVRRVCHAGRTGALRAQRAPRCLPSMWRLHHHLRAPRTAVRCAGCPSTQAVLQTVCQTYGMGNCSATLPYYSLACNGSTPLPRTCIGISNDGLCGDINGMCCPSGQCCSAFGWCAGHSRRAWRRSTGDGLLPAAQRVLLFRRCWDDDAHCGAGCQSWAGKCYNYTMATVRARSPTLPACRQQNTSARDCLWTRWGAALNPLCAVDCPSHAGLLPQPTPRGDLPAGGVNVGYYEASRGLGERSLLSRTAG